MLVSILVVFVWFVDFLASQIIDVNLRFLLWVGGVQHDLKVVKSGLGSVFLYRLLILQIVVSSVEVGVGYPPCV